MQNQRVYSQKPISFQRDFFQFSLVIAVPIALSIWRPGFIPAALLLSTFFILVFIHVRKLQNSMKLILDESGLKFTKGKEEMYVPWEEIKASRKFLKDGEIKSISVLTNKGKLLQFLNFEDMRGISSYLDKHVKAGEQIGMVGSLRLNPYTSTAFAAAFFIGIFMKIHYGPQDPLYDIGAFIQLAGLVGALWMIPKNLRAGSMNSTFTQQLKKYSFYLLLFVGLMTILMVVLILLRPK